MPSDLLTAAMAQHQAGNLAEAERLYRQVLIADPANSTARHYLGLIGLANGDTAAALELLAQSVRDEPANASFRTNLGVALQSAGRTEDALAAFRRAVELDPAAVDAYHNLGLALRGAGRAPEAAETYRRLLAINPGDASGWQELGVTLQELGRHQEAAAAYREAIRFEPQVAQTHNNLGNALAWQNRYDEAEVHYRRALAIDPRYAPAHNNLGIVFREQRRYTEALDCYQRAVAAQPDLSEAWCNLAGALRDLDRLEESLAAAQRGADLGPNLPDAHSILGSVLLSLGEVPEAIAECRRAIALRPDYTMAHSNLLQVLQYDPLVTLEALAAEHAAWDRQHAARLRPPMRRTLVGPRTAPLRLGFVSPDFRYHPVGYFLVPVLEALRDLPCHTIGYADDRQRDKMSQRLAAAASEWVPIWSLDNVALAERIAADRVDVLFDLAGHTAGNRLLVFARQPAPIQVTWIGYAGTTGLAAMDYVLADRHQIPPGSEKHYRERVLRMPEDYVCFDPPQEAPPVGPLPARTSGAVTFGCLNNPAKIGRAVIACWSRILRALPHARLVLRFHGYEVPRVAARYRAWFAEERITPDRVELAGRCSRTELLAKYQRIDVALDPFPYSGGLTTCEALWMGVPVITCPGATMAGRHSLAHLSAVGLTETIATDLAGYVDLAVALAQDLDHLAELRRDLRERVAASPLCDGPQFARQFLALLQTL